MRNLINVNSTNIKTFGFTSTFDLIAKTLTFNISALTVFNGGGAAAVVGIAFNVIDPSGLAIATIDWTAPSINPSTDTTFVVNLVNGFALFGWYQIVGVIRDADNVDYPITLNKEICEPEGFTSNGYVKGVIDINAECDIPRITISELTNFVYKGIFADSVIKSGVLIYPPATLSNVNFTTTPFRIGGSGRVYTGRYNINCTSAAIYDLQDGTYLKITYKVINLEKVVNCTSALSTILCCINDLDDAYRKDPYSTAGLAIKAKMDRITIPFMRAIAKEKSGQDAYKQVNEIANILGCDCNCGSETIEPRAIVSGGDEVNNIVIAGTNATSVTPTTAGSTITYTIDTKNIIVSNGSDDPSFSITRVENDATINYVIAFNYNVLANTILQTILTDEELTNLLKEIVGDTGTNISLEGLDGGCIISLANCNYTLIEANNIIKTIISIVIGGTTYTAPGGLLLSNTTALAAWLNGLSKGTFTATLDGGSANVIINTTTNPNLITLLNISTSGGPIIRQFTRTCIGLVDFLNAVVTYICDLSSIQVEFGETGQTICSFDGGGNVVTTAIDPEITVGALLNEMLAAQCVLFNKVIAIALNCANIKSMFTTSSNAIISGDGVLGIQGGACARISMTQLATFILTAISGSSDLKTTLCSLLSACEPATCALPTNVSAVLTS